MNYYYSLLYPKKSIPLLLFLVYNYYNLLLMVNGKFKNSSGTILDTDWTYAVGSEGLEPGEFLNFPFTSINV